jgi:hypothetical protein
MSLSVVLLALIALVPAGCSGGGKNFTKEDFKKVEKGMAEGKVTEVLGSPMDSLEVLGVKRMWWKVGDDYYSASFKDGKVEASEGPGTKKDIYDDMKGLMQALKAMGK